MKKLKHISIIFFITLFVMSCTHNFEKINTNPNLPENTDASAIMKSTIFNPLNPHINMQFKFIGQVMQYWVYTNISAIDRYQFSSDAAVMNAFWQACYLALRDSKTLANLAEQLGDDGYLATSKILDAYILACLTDIWIDIPASAAGLGLADIAPAYDRQQDIFTTILNNLKEANTLLSSKNPKFSQGGDVLFSGDVEKWKKMANSLRLKYLLQVSNSGKYANAQSEFEAIISDTTHPIITGNSDQAVYDFSGISPNLSDFSVNATLSSITMSDRYVNLMTSGTNTDYSTESDDDPRLTYFAAKANTKDSGSYVGVVSGGPEANAKTIADFDSALKFKTIFQKNKGLLDFAYISYSELQFILAEATLKGWKTQKTTKQYYDEAITANFSYWEITMPSDFLSRQSIQLNTTASANDQLNQILNQKWIAGIGLNIFPIWADHKRTGYPTLKIGSEAMTLSKTIPNRMNYPILEKTVNAANYQNAVSNIGGADNITAKHWYQN